MRRDTRTDEPSRDEVVARAVGDPDASVDEDDAENTSMPGIWMRVFAALFYFIPWIDICTIGEPMYGLLRGVWWGGLIVPQSLMPLYYANPFMPLIIFFCIFLAVVRQKRIPHLVRWNACQAIMMDICSMLYVLVRMYFPAEIRHSAILDYMDRFAWVGSFTAIAYCIYYALRGRYAEIPYVSEACYQQVDMADA
ncbi:unnamed protein product [Pedinophyceae sp. YPF-701]|nr:unnamed protein product [Pedinophyceae sp. YPF-701]